jgi:hypothetical protein
MYGSMVNVVYWKIPVPWSMYMLLIREQFISAGDMSALEMPWTRAVCVVTGSEDIPPQRIRSSSSLMAFLCNA